MNPFHALIFIFLLSVKPEPPKESFFKSQLKYLRVREAWKTNEKTLTAQLESKQIPIAEMECLLLGYKEEEQLELYVRKKGTATYSLFKSYPICYASGELGPKRKEGDRQVPEGLYQISSFNPVSNYHLSLQVNYPNASDRKLSDPKNPGGQIFIHGSCVSIGCLAMRDFRIEEIYLMAVHAKSNGQQVIPVYLFPFQMNRENMEEQLANLPETDSRKSFWKQLEPAWKYWQRERKTIPYSIDSKGKYKIGD